ncbi:MAG TPA: SDR family NAD(P)-dependent oxidoreductase [Gaiellales bacterium]|nr:SDR family NAD(P)-dependent oxidoreductase [Gaiellales bacterium]
MSTVLITGATGGWGGDVLARFVAEGWDVAALHRPGPAPEGLADGVLAVAGDAADPDQAAAAVAAVVERFGSLDAVVNIAGGFEMAGTVDIQSEQVWRRQLRINLDTAWAMTRAAVGPMRAAGRGSIVYVGSAAALWPFAGASAYIVSKAAVLALMAAVDAEVRGEGLRVNTIVPKVVDTPRNRAENPSADHSRWTTGGQLAAAIHWLCSDESAPLSGATIPAYGRA